MLLFLLMNETFLTVVDSFWQSGAEVIFSGPDVPGEGEHKVMDMIRRERDEDEDYKPGKYRHCMYGLDADLIMLSLVTHEPFFILLRETMRARRQNKDAMSYDTEDFELLEVSLLRQMLNQHFRGVAKEMDNKADEYDIALAINADNDNQRNELIKPDRYDLNRLIDDFVFMCFFVGNDFLPNIPHLDIADGSLNLMMNTYQDMPSTRGYLTDKSKIHLGRVELFIQEIARREPLYFQQRATEEKDKFYADDSYKVITTKQILHGERDEDRNETRYNLTLKVSHGY